MKRIFSWNHKLATGHPKTVLGICLLLTIIAGFLATGLSIELNWAALAPKGHEAVEEYQAIMEDFPALSNILVIAESDDYDALEPAAIAVNDRISGLDEYVSSVTYGMDQAFMLSYGMAYLPEEEAQMIGYTFADPNIDSFYYMMNELFREMSTMIDDTNLTDEDSRMLAGYVRALTDISVATRKGFEGEGVSEDFKEHLTTFYAGESLMTSDDRQMAMITIQPSFDMMDINKTMPGVNLIEEIINDIDEQYDNVTLGLTGMHVVARDETASIASDSKLTTILSVILILLLLYIAFRTLLAPIFTFIPLVIGIVWDVGLVQLAIGRLNMITAFSAAMLVGLGIDYAIHLYSAYTGKRVGGMVKQAALLEAMTSTGPSILVGAMTTAAAFLTLNISKLEMLGELGTVMAMGILCTVLAVFWILPAMIVLKKEKQKHIKRIKGHYPIIGKVADIINKRKVFVAILIVALTVFMGIKATDIQFDMNLMNLEPEGLESIELMTYMVEKYNESTDSFSLEVDSLDKVYQLHEAFEAVDYVATVTSIATILPEGTLNKDLSYISDMKDMMLYQQDTRIPDEMVLLASAEGLIEAVGQLKTVWQEKSYKGLADGEFDYLIQAVNDLSEAYQKADFLSLELTSESFYGEMVAIGDLMLEGKAITLEALPYSYKSQFISEDGSKFLINIYPDFDIWDNLNTDKGRGFIEDLQDVDEHITGTPLFMKVIHDSVADDLWITGLLLFGVLMTILMVHFRSIKYVLIAFLPLALTLIFTVGTMVLIDMPFNMLNFLGILLIIGIGIDDGVHILHHYKENPDQLPYVFSSVGRAILLTTLTTMCGFGSLMFSSYRGIATLGKVLFIGVGYAFIMTIVVIPILLKVSSKKEAQ